MKNPKENQNVLSFVERRKLEKLLIEDIETASREYEAAVNRERRSLIEQLETKPPKEVQAIFKRYQDCREALEKVERELSAQGWKSSYGNTGLALHTYGTLTKELAEFDANVNAKKATLASLRRTYTLRLFGRGVEAQDLFADLAKEVSKLVS